ncbi:MAG: hypothetical protein V4722_14820 [Bacteroidota bacterium]
MNLLHKHKRWVWLKGFVLLMAFMCTLQTVQSQTNNTTPPGPVPALSRIEYYMDTDPGYGLATNLAFAPGTSVADQVINIDPATISAGVHRLGIRAKDANGAWSLDNSWLFYKPYSGGSNITPAGPVPALSRIEYYLDTDPGYGLAINIPFAPGTSVADQIINIDPATLSSGVHRIGIRSLDVNGAWSLDNSWLFYKPFSGGSNIPPAGPIPALSRIEYYLDTDPGYGLATNVPFAPGSSVADQIINIDPASITAGVHVFGIRSRDANGAWSLDNRWLFFKPYTANGTNVSPPTTVPPLTRVEYYFDTDPGYGNGIAVALDPVTNLPDFTSPINVTGLSTGAHKLGFRSKDANGAWSLDNKWEFTVPSLLPAPTIVTNSVTKLISCAKDSLSVSYHATGTYNGGNIFNVELSDAAGSFASPTIIGSYTGTGNSIIKCRMPLHTPDGTNYRIRVSSTSPVLTGIAGSDALTIRDRPYAQTITGRTHVNGTYTWPYTVPTMAGSSWNWTLTGGSVAGGQTTNAVNLLWNQPASPAFNSNILVLETNQYGCLGDSSILPVTVYRLNIKDTVQATACKADIIAVKTGATGAFDAGNNFIAELSNSSGSFASPLATTSISANGNGVNQLNTINLTIPFSVPNGTGYRIRVRSTNPAFTGDTTGVISIIKPDLGADLTRTYCIGRGYNLMQNFTDGSLTYGYYTNAFVLLTRPDSVEAGVYQIIGTNSQGCKDTAMLTLTSNPTPNLGPDVFVYHDCLGETTNLNPLFNTSGLTVQWNTGNTNTAQPGVYRLIVTNAFGCTDTAFANIVLEVATWTGTVSSNWHTPGNWNINKVPTNKTHVIVATGTPNQCIVSTGNGEAASIQVRNGATVRTNSGRLVDVKGKCVTLPQN